MRKTLEEKRLELHETLCTNLGSRNVYFQPPSSVKMSYPAIVYSRDAITNAHANNNPYINDVRYRITLISKDPDNSVIDKMLALPLCGYDRSYAADNLNHDVFTLYY